MRQFVRIKTKQSLLRGGLFVLWLCVLVVLSLSPLPKGTSSAHPFFAILAHIIFYLVLSILALWALNRPAKYYAIAVAVLCALFGAILEVLQGFVGRTPDLYDGLANTGGAILGTLLYFGAEKARRRRLMHRGWQNPHR